MYATLRHLSNGPRTVKKKGRLRIAGPFVLVTVPDGALTYRLLNRIPKITTARSRPTRSTTSAAVPRMFALDET